MKRITGGVIAAIMLTAFLFGTFSSTAQANACLDGNCTTQASAGVYTSFPNHSGVDTSITNATVCCFPVYAFENIYYGPCGWCLVNQHSATVQPYTTASWRDPHDALAYGCGNYRAAITVYNSNWGVIFSGTKYFCY